MTKRTKKTRMKTHCRFRVQRSSHQIGLYDAFVGSATEPFDDFTHVADVKDAADVEDAVGIGDAVDEGDAEEVEDAVEDGVAVVAVMLVEDVAEARNAKLVNQSR